MTAAEVAPAVAVVDGTTEPVKPASGPLPCIGLSTGSGWEDAASLRGEFLPLDRLVPHAMEIARAHGELTLSVSGPLQGRFSAARTQVREAYRALTRNAQTAHEASPAEEWLLDNSHVIEDQFREIEEDLPAGYLSKLPRLVRGPMAGYPRSFALCLDYLRHTDARLEPETLVPYVSAYQQVRSLTIGELWAVPIMLRLGLVMSIGRLAEREADTSARTRADALCVRLLAQGNDLAGLRATLQHAEGEQVTAPLLLALMRRLREHESQLVSDWIVAQAAKLRLSPQELTRQQHLRQAADQVSVGNAITSMRAIGALDWRKFFEQTSEVEAILRTDPAGAYANTEPLSRDRYRHAVEDLARRSDVDEAEVARATIALAAAAKRDAPEDPGTQHVGYYLVDAGRPRLERQISYRPTIPERLRGALLRRSTFFYLGTISVLTALGVAAGVATGFAVSLDPLMVIAIGLLLVLPSSEVALTLLNWAVTALLPPRLLAKLDFSRGVPRAHATLVVVPSLLDSPAGIDRLIEDLETRALANLDENLSFALLTDFTDHPQAVAVSDAALIAQARAGIAELNRKHRHGQSDCFFLLHRRRQHNPSQATWMGWERKRGKLDELNRLLRGATDTSFEVVTAPQKVLARTRYVITLDADTQLPREVARRLVEAIAHPLNRPQLDPSTHQVVRGYGIIQPRVGTRPTSARLSHFARIAAGHSGLDPYTTAVSDVYQDLFGEGSYIGKGIYDVDAFEACLHDRVPDNTLLSHDLFEGVHARTALATDIELLDDQPSEYAVHAGRQHRWVRGDWQLLPWLRAKVPHRLQGTHPNPLQAMARWRFFDNLRRSLVAPALLALLLIGWFTSPGLAALATVALAAVLLAPLYGWLGMTVLHKRTPRSPTLLTSLRGDLPTNSLRALLSLTFLLDQSLSMLDATGRTLYRLFGSRKNLLEWTTMSQAQRRFAGGSSSRRLVVGAILSALVLAGVAWVHPLSTAFAAPVLLLWVAAPFAAWALSRPTRVVDPAGPLTVAEKLGFRLLARKTWSFFETFVTAEEHWLPPDNFQEAPRPVVAHRTSPTNIGLYLLSTVAARDFGFLTLAAMRTRLDATLTTIESLEKREGHVLNWYETTTLAPLEPRYVSTVDSGNLAAYLWTLKAACAELPTKPIFAGSALEAARDALALFALERPEERATVEPLIEALAVGAAQKVDLSKADVALRQWIAQTAALCWSNAAAPASARTWLNRAHEGLVAAAEEVRALAPWAPNLDQAPAALSAPQLNEAWAEVVARLRAASTPRAIVQLGPAIHAPLEALASQVADSPALSPVDRGAVAGFLSALGEQLQLSTQACEALIAALTRLGERAGAIADAMNFRFLFDAERALFTIGYNVSAARLDSSYYDLLASEARLASLVAIAKGDAPVDHWFRLGRPRTELPQGRVLLSWSGSMFEFLMPLLVMKRPPGTLLDETVRVAVDRQRAYGKECHVPWGVSESAYNMMDLSMTYQYRAFGVPGLGLKQGLADDLVVAPYATALAALIRPDLAAQNFRALEKAQLAGPYGFYEAIDYTPSHLPPGKHGVVVKCFMAHHQGMALVALDNVLNDGPMQRRFHDDPRVRATELLLEERVPVDAPLLAIRTQRPPSQAAVESDLDATEQVTLEAEPLRLHVLGHGDLSTVISAVGTGFTIWKGMDLYRFREDTVDPSGLFIYLRDVEAGQAWSAAYEPLRTEPQRYHAAFSADRVELRRRDGDLETVTELTVSPEQPAEVRRISVTNHGLLAHTVELTTYTELVLAPRAADVAHRAFSSMFVHTEALAEHGAVLARRRGRSAEDVESYLLQVLAPEEGEWKGAQLETSRARFIGRGNTPRNPAALRSAQPLSGTTGDVLDPIVALRRTVKIEPGKTARISLTTALASNREAALELVSNFASPQAIHRTFDLGWADARVELRHLGITGAQAERSQRLLSLLLLPRPQLRLPVQGSEIHGQTRDALWSHGISGDLPILLLRLDDPDFATLCAELIAAHQFWRANGLAVDFVILNDEPGSYEQPVQNQALSIVEASAAHAQQNQRGGVFVRRSEQLTPDARTLLLGAARVVLKASGGSLGRQLRKAWQVTRPAKVPIGKATKARAMGPALTLPPGLDFANGLGGFSKDGREYVMGIGPESIPPAPWCNVIANPQFGCVISERGAGFTWASNSQSHRLTPWSNDAVADPVCDAIYLRDEQSAEVWSATPAPAGGAAMYRVSHGQGYSRFEHTRGGLEHALTVFVSPTDPVKLSLLKVTNRGPDARALSVYGYAEWVLGSSRERSRLTVVTELDIERSMVIAQNPASVFPARRAFFTATQRPVSLTADRDEFFGARGGRERPGSVDCGPLSGRSGGGLDPCAALQLQVRLEPGQTVQLTFALGEGSDQTAALALAHAHQQPGRADAELAAAIAVWDRTLGTAIVKTPDPALDLMLNRWLLYQCLSARIWARSGFYQSGGAYGFRDQLQDVLALMQAEPVLAREHVLRSAARQFVEGDVQHWWHPESGEGVRTRCSDDLLFLPYVTAAYVRATGDTSILDVAVPFLEAKELGPDDHDVFSAPNVTRDTQPLYEHCLRAISRGTTVGPRGLPLMRAGDWNDGMNRVGKGEKGESVWLAWFLIRTLRDFEPLARARGDAARAAHFLAEVTRLTAAVEAHAWDGEWYQRASYDDGTPLGSKVNAQCQIDAIAQSWAVIAGTGDPARALTAVQSSDRLLFRESDKMFLLFTPPFTPGGQDPGYIGAYPPGVRENGGQYTHGVLWTVLATALLGEGDRAMHLLSALNPINHGRSPDDVQRYAVEPYVIAADVYSLAGAVGRGGWTWYTGSASWMYRIAFEQLLGVQLRAGKLVFAPVIPRGWPRYEVDYRGKNGRYRIVVENPHGLARGACEVELDGVRVPDGEISLDGPPGDHAVRVRIVPAPLA